MSVGVLNYPRKTLSTQERIIRATLARIASSATSSPGDITTVHSTSDQTFTSSTVANVTNLLFNVTNGSYNHFRFFLMVRNSAVNEGAKFTLTTPTFSRFAAYAHATFGDSGAALTWDGNILSSGDAVTTVNFPVVNTDYPITIEGVIVPSAFGAMQLKAGNESGVCTVTVRQGSCGILTVL